MNSYGAPYWLENCRMSKFSGLPGRMSEEIPVYVSLYHPSWLSFWPYYYLEGNKQKIANFKVKIVGIQKMFMFCEVKLTYFTSAAAKLLQSRPTLCDTIDGSPPGSPVPGILQARNWSGLPFPSPMHESEKWKWSHFIWAPSPLLIATVGSINLLCLEGFPHLPGAPQHEARLMRKFET